MQPDKQTLIDQSHMDNLLVLEIQHPIADGVKMFGCRQGDISYCISFDTLCPESGWRASWQREGQKTTFVRRIYSSQKEAVAALKKIARRHAS